MCPVNRYNRHMARMRSRTHRAFKDTGAPDDNAREATEETASLESRLIRLEVMVALTLAGVVSLVLKTFSG